MSVSTVEDALARHPTPFERQIPCPMTVAVVKFAVMAFNVVPVADVKDKLDPVALVNVNCWSERAPVDVPPANWMAFVVTFPAFVTVWSVPVAVPSVTQDEIVES